MRELPELVVKERPLATFSSWRVGGSAEYYSAPKCIDELQLVVDWALKSQIKITVLGGGTNVLISDQGVEGLVLHTRYLNNLKIWKSKKSEDSSEVEMDFDDFEKGSSERLNLEAEAGVPKSLLLKAFLKEKLAPSLFLAGLPGDVGGGVAMNAGVGESLVPREFVEIVDWVEVLSWKKQIAEADDNRGSGFEFDLKRFQKNELNWGYRQCRGWQPGVIVRVGLSWPLKTHSEIAKEVREANKLRMKKQPLDMPSCGSVFTNPLGHKAGQLIEEVGLKGTRIGDAQISEKHANFIVNLGEAKSGDIHRLIELAQETVLKKKNIEIKAEVVRLGTF